VRREHPERPLVVCGDVGEVRVVSDGRGFAGEDDADGEGGEREQPPECLRAP